MPKIYFDFIKKFTKLATNFLFQADFVAYFKNQVELQMNGNKV